MCSLDTVLEVSYQNRTSVSSDVYTAWLSRCYTSWQRKCLLSHDRYVVLLVSISHDHIFSARKLTGLYLGPYFDTVNSADHHLTSVMDERQGFNKSCPYRSWQIRSNYSGLEQRSAPCVHRPGADVHTDVIDVTSTVPSPKPAYRDSFPSCAIQLKAVTGLGPLILCTSRQSSRIL